MDARAILDRLIAFPTVSRDSNLDLIGWVEDYLAQHGVAARKVYDDTGQKAALYANVGPDVPGGVVLSGHTDVVPVDGQDWHTDPWTVTEKGGRLYGRGTCDMKGFLALALAAVPQALAGHLARPLQLALSYDEEVGCTGAPRMIDDMVAHLPPASAAIIGEPSMLRTVTAHKGGLGWRVQVHGFEVHSSLLDRGVSAVMQAATIIEWANGMNDAFQAATPTALAAAFDPPFTTAHVGMIEGGTAHNITAKDCRFLLSFRTVPGEDAGAHEAAFRAEVARVEARMQAVRPETRIEVVAHMDVPGLRPEEGGAAEALIRRLTGDNASHVVSYGTEAGQFQQRGYSAVVCGPGDIAQAHQPDEYIETAQFAAGGALLGRVVETLRA